MSVDLVNFEAKAKDAVMSFWGNRSKARQKQLEIGSIDQGERGGVTAGKNMDGFLALVADVVRANGISVDCIHRERRLVTLPGYFRPTKLWDLVVVRNGKLVAAIELKSQVGPSFGNNFNNRTEEAIGTAHDLWVAYRESAFGQQIRPFVGWLMVVEDCPESRKPVSDRTVHFPVSSEFRGASYLKRYDILCQRLVQERLYSCATVLATPRAAEATGEFSELSEMTGLKPFVATLAGAVASASSL